MVVSYFEFPYLSLITNLKIAKKISEMIAEDETVRDQLVEAGVLFDGYHPEMKAVHDRNCLELQKIISEYGLPTEELIGKELVETSWRLIMHSISHPDFMRSCLVLMRDQVAKGRYEFKYAAALEDRICFYEGRPQIYGTNFDFDENQIMNPTPIADIAYAEKARAENGMLSLSEAIKRQQAFNDPKPRDIEAKRLEFLNWTKQSGWRS